jgi:hypothetical protein
MVALTMDKPSDGHAYSVDIIKRVRNFLRADTSLWPDAKLLRHTDEFAVLVGMRIRTERKLKSADRVQDITSRLLEPVETLLQAVKDDDFSNEFVAPWGDLRNIDLDHLIDTLQDLANQANNHIATIERSGAKGKPWDSYLKEYFVGMLSVLCEFIDREFEPSAKGTFNKLAYLLGEDLFDLHPTKKRLVLDGAIRKHVDNWNANKTRLFEQSRL